MTITPGHLAHLIAAHGDTPSGLAARAQINPANLDLYLEGRAQPCPREQQRLALALGTTTSGLHDPDTLAA